MYVHAHKNTQVCLSCLNKVQEHFLWLLYVTLKEQISCKYTNLTFTPCFTIKWHSVIHLTNNTGINVTVLNIHWTIAWKVFSSILNLNTDIFAYILRFTYLAHIMTHFSIFLAYIQLFVWLLTPHCTLHGQTPQSQKGTKTQTAQLDSLKILSAMI